MTKLELWSSVLAIGEQHKLKKAVMDELEALLAPKSRAAREVYTLDGVDYKFCRFTGFYWPTDKMIYQNDEQRSLGRDKGYSQVGIAMWNKGQNYIKNLTNKLLDAVTTGDTESQQKVLIEIKDIKAGNLGNRPAWLGQFIDAKQMALIESESKFFESTL